MEEITRQIPDVVNFVSLEPEELGGVILNALCQRFPVPNGGNQSMFSGTSLMDEFYRYRAGAEPVYPANRRAEVEMLFMEAWSWLEVNLLIVRPLENMGHHENRLLSRRGRRVHADGNFAGFRLGSKLSQDALHPSMQSVWQSFIRNDFTTAIFQAMREVEIAVRSAAGLTDREYGVELMATAFHESTGALTDIAAQPAEKTALKMLFMGAIGSYKNPHSHRHVPLNDPQEAVEIIMLASHLLRIVDTRRPVAAAVV